MQSHKKITLITGGVKSGKSSFVLELASKISGKKCFVATATAFDEYMFQKIKKHQLERGKDFKTIEEPLYLAKALDGVDHNVEAVVVDCLTLWTNNLLYHFEKDTTEMDKQIQLVQDVLQNIQVSVFIVTNEVGLGIMPDNVLAQKYSDQLGLINQKIAQVSDDVIFMVSGIPQWIKGGCCEK